MNTRAFLTCLASQGVNTGSNTLGLYSFNSGTNSVIFNQIYSTGQNFYNNYPYNASLPLIYLGSGNQPSGFFSKSQAYQISNGLTSNFSAILSLNYSGCLNSGNINYLLASTVGDYNLSNSGVAVGITPSNRVFFNTKNYSYTIHQEINIGDFVYFNISNNRFVNVGLFVLKDNTLYSNNYDAGDSILDASQLYIGGMLNYPPNFTGYYGVMKDIYLFSGFLNDNVVNSCIDCSYATGLSFTQYSVDFGSSSVTGSYWQNINQIQTTGYQKALKSYTKQDNTTGSIYYDSGVTGSVLVNQLLVAQTQAISNPIIYSGVSILYDNNKRIENIVSDFYFDLGLFSGDIVEIYTYPKFNSNIGLSIFANFFPKTTGEVQIFGNGLAETKNVDYSVTFDNLINGFDSNDILLYDVYPSTITMPYQTGYISTGVSGAGYISITGISGINLSSGFNYDFYLNGQKMTSGLNFSYSGAALRVSGND